MKLLALNNSLVTRKDDTWQRRCELYLFDCGVTQEEIASLRDIMLAPVR